MIFKVGMIMTTTLLTYLLYTNTHMQVMKNQEAVDLTWHIQNPNEAAKCLANEALNRFSKRNISCIIIRFD